MSVRAVIVNGRPSSGKTSFENICRQLVISKSAIGLGWDKKDRIQILITSTVDFVKEIATKCGWDNSKTLKNRKFLSNLKDLLTDWGDIPYRKIIELADELRIDSYEWILFIDCREPHEIQRLKEALNATTVLIRRPGDELGETSNHADKDVFNYNYDLTIWNNSDIINLEKKAKDFMKYMKGAPQYEYAN